jgi:hypothetical protein
MRIIIIYYNIFTSCRTPNLSDFFSTVVVRTINKVKNDGKINNTDEILIIINEINQNKYSVMKLYMKLIIENTSKDKVTIVSSTPIKNTNNFARA